MNISKHTPIRASSAVIIKNNKILLLKRSKKVKSYKNYWQLPEGKINFREFPENAIIRELFEEIGHKPSSVKFKNTFLDFVHPFSVPIPFKRYVFFVNPPKKIKLSHEHSDYKWCTKNDLKKIKLIKGTERIVRRYL